MATRQVRTFLWLCLLLSGAGQLLAVPVPAKDSGASFGSNHQLGASDGQLYLFTGDTVYQVDLTNVADPQFTPHVTGVRSAFGSPRAFEGGFATGAGGRAAVTFGYSDGGVALIDLNAMTTQGVPDVDGDTFNDDNVFSLAISPTTDATFAMWADRSFPPSSSTLLYRIDEPTLTSDEMVDADPGRFSGGMAFDAAGNLFIGTFDATGVFPDPVGKARFFRIDAADIAAFESMGTTPPVTFLGEGGANGNGSIVVVDDGRIFTNTTTGLGEFDPNTGVLTNFFGDITDTGLFFYNGFELPLNGLAYEPLTDRLVTAQFNSRSDEYELVVYELGDNGGGSQDGAIPEPATGLCVLCGLIVVATRRRRCA